MNTRVRKNVSMRTGIILLMVAILTLVAMTATFAKYVTNGNFEDQARVAKWGLNITAEEKVDLFNAEYKNQDGSTTVQADDKKTHVIAPGTDASKSIIIDVDGNAPEVAYDFDLNLAITDGDDHFDPSTSTVARLDRLAGWHWVLYRNGSLYGDFKTHAEVEHAVNAMSQKFVEPNALPDWLNPNSKNTLTLGWYWEFFHNERRDAQDTELGNMVAKGLLDNLNAKLTISATQVADANTPQVTVAFDTRGGSKNPDSQTFDKGGKATEPDNPPTRDGFEFLGWHTDKLLDTPWDFDTKVNSNMTLFAHWKLITYQLEFDASGCKEDPSAITRILPNTTFATSGNTLTLSDGRSVTVEPDDDHMGNAIWEPASGVVDTDPTIVKVSFVEKADASIDVPSDPINVDIDSSVIVPVTKASDAVWFEPLSLDPGIATATWANDTRNAIVNGLQDGSTQIIFFVRSTDTYKAGSATITVNVILHREDASEHIDKSSKELDASIDNVPKGDLFKEYRTWLKNEIASDRKTALDEIATAKTKADIKKAIDKFDAAMALTNAWLNSYIDTTKNTKDASMADASTKVNEALDYITNDEDSYKGTKTEYVTLLNQLFNGVKNDIANSESIDELNEVYQNFLSERISILDNFNDQADIDASSKSGLYDTVNTKQVDASNQIKDIENLTDETKGEYVASVNEFHGEIIEDIQWEAKDEAEAKGRVDTYLANVDEVVDAAVAQAERQWEITWTPDASVETEPDASVSLDASAYVTDQFAAFAPTPTYALGDGTDSSFSIGVDNKGVPFIAVAAGVEEGDYDLSAIAIFAAVPDYGAKTSLEKTVTVTVKQPVPTGIPYAELSSSSVNAVNDTLTFKYGTAPASGEGVTWWNCQNTAGEDPEHPKVPGWSKYVGGTTAAESTVTTVVFDNSFKDARPTSCYYWFSANYNCSKITNFKNIKENFNTSRVTNFSHVFYRCSTITKLDVSGFDTSACKDMSYMFSSCNQIIELDVSGFNTGACTSMKYMFADSSNIETLDVSDFEISKCTDISSMFTGASSVKNLDVGGWNTSNCTNMSFLFGSCKQLESIPDVSKWDTHSCTDLSYMFSSMYSLEDCAFKDSVPDVSKWDLSNCQNLCGIFQLNKFMNKFPDVSKWNTKSCENMSRLFSGCENALGAPDVSGFNTRVCTDFSDMFASCKKMQTVPNVNGFNTDSCTTMRRMFVDCSSLTHIDFSDFNVEACGKISSMFDGCSELKTINLMGWKLGASVALDTTYLFRNCSNLERIYCNDTWNADKIKGGIFYGCNKLPHHEGGSDQKYCKPIADGGNFTPLYDVTLDASGANMGHLEDVDGSVLETPYTFVAPYDASVIVSAPSVHAEQNPFALLWNTITGQSNDVNADAYIEFKDGETTIFKAFAKPTDPYVFKEWAGAPATITKNITITATFDTKPEPRTRHALQDGDKYYLPVFKCEDGETAADLGYHFYVTQDAKDEITKDDGSQVDSMGDLAKYAKNLYVEVENGKGVAGSGKCVAVRCDSEEFNIAAYGDSASTSMEKVTEYKGEKAIKGKEYWCGLDWDPSVAGKKEPTPYINYKEKSEALETGVSLTDMHKSYGDQLTTNRNWWACVPSDETYAYAWTFYNGDYNWRTTRRQPYSNNVVFSRAFGGEEPKPELETINFKNIEGIDYYPVFSSVPEGTTFYDENEQNTYTSMNANIHHAKAPKGTKITAIRAINTSYDNVYGEDGDAFVPRTVLEKWATDNLKTGEQVEGLAKSIQDLSQEPKIGQTTLNSIINAYYPTIFHSQYGQVLSCFCANVFDAFIWGDDTHFAWGYGGRSDVNKTVCVSREFEA